MRFAALFTAELSKLNSGLRECYRPQECFVLKFIYFIIFTPNVGLELMTLRSRVALPTEAARRPPGQMHFNFLIYYSAKSLHGPFTLPLMALDNMVYNPSPSICPSYTLQK